MDPVSPPDSAGGTARVLLALRHALADPLSAISLKLELVERRLSTPAGADPSWITERIRASQVDVRTANRLIDLMLRLAEIVAERPEEASLADLCRAAGVGLAGPGAAVPRLTLRPRAAGEAIQSVATFVGRGEGCASPIARAELEDGSVVLTLEGSRMTADASPERLLDLPHGMPEAEALFAARAAVEADDGSLELIARGGRLVARLSWPVPQERSAR